MAAHVNSSPRLATVLAPALQAARSPGALLDLEEADPHLTLLVAPAPNALGGADMDTHLKDNLTADRGGSLRGPDASRGTTNQRRPSVQLLDAESGQAFVVLRVGRQLVA